MAIASIDFFFQATVTCSGVFYELTVRAKEKS